MTTQETICQNKKAFLKRYLDYGSVGETLKSIGIKSRMTFYTWMKADPNFKRIYEEELLPARRDEVISVVYRAATGRLGTYTETTTKKNGDVVTAEMPIVLPQTQLTAAFGFLKATDHNDDPKSKDRVVFIEKNQIELAGKDGGPVVIRVVEDGNNTP
ncbi:MAG: hypothetical protein PHV11_08075 [Candidatus Bipolaricaulis sp.]|nr:hypothetical protein [Candidatus Bipolaricaulis sp.]